MIGAEVYLWGTRIGIVAFDDSTGLGSFEYDTACLASEIEVSPIMMPLSRRVFVFPELPRKSFHGLPGLLADSLPDKFGNAVIDAWLRTQGRSPDSFNPVERLCYTGSRGMGALEYVPALGPNPRESESIEIDGLVKLASEILQNRENMHIPYTENAMAEIIKVGTSAGGARAKAVIAWNKVTGDIRSGQIQAGDGYEYWLIKFDDVSGNGDKEGNDGPQYTKIEYAYYLMAKDAGLQMSECQLFHENGRSHFMTRRFDRDPMTGAKFHMQTLGGIAHFDFNQSGVYSYEQAVEVMRRLRFSNKEISQFYRRMVFNVFARNQDDHVKNISFLMDRTGKWSLAPAYDITYAYNPGGMWTGAHQMTINGKQSAIDLQDLFTSGHIMGLRKTDIENIISNVRTSLTQWDKFAESAGLPEQVAEKISKQFEIP